MKLVVAAALLASIALTGCVTIATINVDGKRGPTYVVPFGGLRIERAPADAVGVKALGLGAWRLCHGVGIGVVSCFAADARPGTSIAIIDGRALGRVPSLEETTHEDHPIRSAGGDGP